MKIFKRLPFDEWYFELFKKMVTTLPNNAEAYYFASFNEVFEDLIQEKFESSLVLLFIVDNLQYHSDYNPTQTRTVHAQVLLDIALKNPATTFIISTAMDYLDREIAANNVHLICHGGLQMQHTHHRESVLDKSNDNLTTFMCLNRSLRPHRYTTVSYLLGTELDQFGYITFNPQLIDKKYNSWLDLCNWKLTTQQQNLYLDTILKGFQKAKQGNGVKFDFNKVNATFKQSLNNNVNNFNLYLKPIYQHTFIEIITESNFCEPSSFLTEKFLQNIYGANFPIVLAPVRTVEHLRRVGFDMFDDIINHSYDTIENPLDRIISAIELNRELLINLDNTKTLWYNNRYRFEKNIDFAKNCMYNYYEASSLNELQKILINEQK